MANTAGMDISVRRIIGAVLAALLAAIIHAGAKSHSEPEQGIASFVGAHEFELKSRQSPFDTLGIERTPSYLKVYTAGLTFRQRYKEAIDNGGGSHEPDLSFIEEACNKIWPGYQEAEITRGKLKTTSSYYVFDSIRNDLVTMRFHQGDILFEVHVSIADIFEEVVMIIPYSRKVECPHHDSADQHGCRVCMGAGVHVVSNLKMRFVLPRGVINNEVFVARGQGDYSPRAGKYGDINIIVKTLNVRGFIRGPVDRFTGSSSDLYVAREINERVDTVELTGIFNSEKVVFKYQDTAEDIKANELYNPKFSKIYSDLKSKYKLTDSDFFTLEALNYQCLPNLGLPFRKIPALRGRLCLPRIDSRDLYNSKGLLNSLHQLAEKRFQAYIDVLKTLDSKSKSGAAREHLTYKSSSPIEPIAVSPDRGSPYSHYADDDL